MDCVENDDLLQPHFKKKKTVTNPKPKHFKAKVGEGGGEREGGREKDYFNSYLKLPTAYIISHFFSLPPSRLISMS